MFIFFAGVNIVGPQHLKRAISSWTLEGTIEIIARTSHDLSPGYSSHCATHVGENKIELRLKWNQTRRKILRRLCCHVATVEV